MTVLAGVTALLSATAVAGALPSQAAGPATTPAVPFVSGTKAAAATVVRTLKLPTGGQIRVDSDGVATQVAKSGKTVATRQLTVTAKTPLGTSDSVPDDLLRDLFSPAATQQPTSLVAVLSKGVAPTGKTLPGARSNAIRQASTSDPALNTALHTVGAKSLTTLSVATSDTVLVDVGTHDLAAAVRTLRASHGVVSVEASQPVASEATGSRPILPAPATVRKKALATPAGAGALPTNYALTSSLGAYLNSQGIDAMGAYSTLTGEYGQLPGTGERITNVSVGDLTDQSMADGGDSYVRYYGPTTVVRSGQRYLDLPSMPLIPTYVAQSDGSLDGLGTTEGVDPTLGEVMLDFGVMAPLPHNLQRSGALGTGDTDLLGIAPGASYRLVVPAEPTTDQIAVAMLAAARQTPRPNVITASLGVGTDSVGFPGRYLEDDPLLESVIGTIVHQYGVVVTISANDGTRLYTPTTVNPDGGSTPTNVTSNPDATTDVNDDALSTTPSTVLDSGAIAVGATTLDDVLTQPGQPTGTQVRTGTFATTRINGATAYSSGFGTRVNVSAPGDGIASYEHTVGGAATDVTPGLEGGTSASAPEVAAAAAVVQQASRLAGHVLAPTAIRALLEKTGRTVASPAQSDRPTTVGPQVDLSAAVRSVLAAKKQPKAGIVRVSVAHHVDLGNLEGDYSEDTDPQRLDLSGDSGTDQGSGEGLLGPVTFGVDTVGLPAGTLSYQLHVGKTVFTSATPSIRISPTQLLHAAGDAVSSTDDRYVDYRVSVVRQGKTLATTSSEITVGPTDGTYTVARAPVVAPRVSLGAPVQVSYDLTGVRSTQTPQLVVSTVGHNTPTAGLFTPAYSVALTKTKGTLTLPASAFSGGGGVYGVGIAQDTQPSGFTYNIYADMASVLVVGPNHGRPVAPVLAAANSVSYSGDVGHSLEVTRAAPNYSLAYDVRSVAGAKEAIYEISATGPTVFGALNTVTNPFGTQRDVDGVSTPSVAFTTVKATHGVLKLDARTLPTDAVLYNIRVFAADAAGHPIGEGSPTSGLEYDNGYPPDGGTVRSFDAVSGHDSVAAVENPTGGQTVYRFDPATGAYGAVITADPTVGDGYQVVGVDTSLHRVELLHFDTDTQQITVETRSTTTSAKIAATTYDVSDHSILGGRVDSARHEALLLGRRGSDNADLLFVVDLRTGKVGAPILADTGGVPAGSFYDLELNPKNGSALLEKVTGGTNCGSFGTYPLASVAPATGVVTQYTTPSCTAALLPDAHSGSLVSLLYRSFSLNFAGNTVVNSATLADPATSTAAGTVRQEAPSLLAVDGTNDVTMAGFSLPLSPQRLGSAYGYPQDSNATGQLAELNRTTGATTKLLTGMELGGVVSQGVYNPATERRVQLDPTTRTGWTYSSDGSQLQSFAY